METDQLIFEQEPIEIAEGIFWVGYADNNRGLHCNPYLIIEGNEAVMKTHVLLGYETLAKAGQDYDRNAFLKMGMDIALYHHEKWNGSGYVHGLAGNDIPISARIMAIADVYDALRSKRVYKEAFSHEKSVDIISADKGSHFDPDLIDAFVQHQDQFESLYLSIG